MDVSIANLLFLVIGLLAGGVCGYMLNPERIKNLKEDVHVIKSIARNKNKVGHNNLGTIRRPTAQQLSERGTLIEATKEAMRETLSKDPYLNENYQG